MDVSLGDLDEEDARVLEGYIALLQRYTDDLDVEPKLEQKLSAPKLFKDQLWGTADAVFITNHTLVVVDLKTGRVPVEAEDNWQLTAYAALAMEFYGLWERVSEIEIVIYSPCSTDGVAFKNQVMDKAELRQKLYHIREGVNFALSPEGQVTFRPGEAQCRWCDLAGQCKAQIQATTDLDFLESYENFALLDKDQQVALVEQVPFVRKTLDQIEETATDQMLAGQELPGLKLVEGRTIRKWDSPSKVMRVLEASGLDPETYSDRKLKSPTQAAKNPDVIALVGDHVVKPKGKPKIAPEDDRRPAFDPSTDFPDD
jgi:hypothetical protein